jgi:SPX domain protein involved in polyphosphate accumulation
MYMQQCFKRYEMKYLLTSEQYAAVSGAIACHMRPDPYGEYLVQSLYYDTENWDVIRTSMKKPIYKEKMRLRRYGGSINKNAPTYLELKKKYRGVVYKRRTAIPNGIYATTDVKNYVSEGTSQIARELAFYLRNHNVSERIYIAYRRDAYVSGEGSLRVTFDTRLCFRTDMLDFSHPGEGWAVLPPDTTLMEIKTSAGVPLWLTQILSDKMIYPRPLSKCAVCYTAAVQDIGCRTEGKVSISA